MQNKNIAELADLRAVLQRLSEIQEDCSRMDFVSLQNTWKWSGSQIGEKWNATSSFDEANRLKRSNHRNKWEWENPNYQKDDKY